MHINNIYEYRQLARINTESGRKYIVDDGEPLPSVTTILSKTQDHSFLDVWKSRVGHAEAERITTSSANLGTGMHSNLENFVLGKPITGTFMQQALANLIIKKGLVNVSEVWGIEVSVYYAGLYAGTTDMVGVYNGKPSIIDFKNSLRLKKLEWIDGYRAQLGAYALAHNEMYNTNINHGVIMIATRDAEYQEFIFDGTEFQKCVDLWLTLLDKYYTLTSSDNTIIKL